MALFVGGCASRTRVIQVESVPAGASVRLDGVSLGPTPLAPQQLKWKDAKTTMEVRVELDGFEGVKRTIAWSEAREAKDPWLLRFELAPLTDSVPVVIDSNVPEAAVRINGVNAGRTPLRVNLKFVRPSAAEAWSTMEVEVAKERFQHKGSDGTVSPVYATTLNPASAKAGKVFATLEPVKFYSGTIRRFLVGDDGIRTQEEAVLSQVGEIEREPKASAVTKITASEVSEPLFETKTSVTPDGEQIAYAVPVWTKGKDEPVGANIWLRRGMTEATRMTDGEFFDVEPSMTADGEWIYFSSNRLGRMNIWRMPTKGRGGLTKITDSPSSMVDYEPVLSPDGKRLAYTSQPTGAAVPQIWFANPDGTLPTQIRTGRNPAWSPDSKRLAYVAPDPVTGHDTIWVMDADGGNPTRLTGPDCNSRHPTWSSDGLRLIYASDKALNEAGQSNFDIWSMNADGSSPTQLTVNGSYDSRPSVSADGRYLYFVSNRGAQQDRQDTLQVWRISF